ncbi:DMT family transporter [Corynebacterium poyangense]|uniref:DMT family transporter n=1 Tax=Corynebacterium poyangense TaxID=2684405 RepID=UPI00296250AD|nr:DMT family transporter [Corynebacterium poyangense]
MRWTRQPLPRGRQWIQVAVVAIGAVLGFPLLTSYALHVTPASHGAVVIALLPAATAVIAVLRTKEQPGALFWGSALAGAIAAVIFALHSSGSLSTLTWPDLLLFLAVALCAIGYAEGGVLSRSLGSWQTISWTLVISLPLMTLFSGVALVHHPPSGSLTTWLAFAYLSVISMFLGFFAWYRGLALGPMSQVSLIQLSQPVMSLVWAWLLLGEHITLGTVIGGFVVIACALSAVRARVH